MNKKRLLMRVGFIMAGIALIILLWGINLEAPVKKTSIDFTINNTIPNEVISNKYVENGFSIHLSLLNTTTPSIILSSDIESVEYPLETVFDHDYQAYIDIDKLKNGYYQLLVKDGLSASPIINNLDTLEQLVRSQINDKLITFDYTNNYMNLEISDFEYEYDILIDPGHGGIDGGTVNETMTEADFNLLQSLYEKNRYEEHGLKVLLSREDASDGMMIGNDEWNRAKKRGYAIGYYGVTARIVYSNHHNYTVNANTTGFEILVSNSLNTSGLEIELEIIEDLKNSYPTNLINNSYLMYSRDYETGMTFNKEDATVYSYRDYYATIRIPLELYNVKTVTYEGCYMSNQANFNWYYHQEGWKIMSEVKIKNYVEALGKTYIPV